MPDLIQRGRIRRRPAMLAAVCCAALAVAGCAAVPGSGPVKKVRGGGGQAQAFVQPLPPPRPQQGWSPQTVVEGFLAASAVVANNYQAARQFLAPPLNQSWHPTTVTIVGPVPNATSIKVSPGLIQPGEPTKFKEVKVSGQRLATLTPNGQYTYQPSSPTYVFRLAFTNGQWLIDSMSASNASAGSNANNLLLLTEDDFEQVYQPRNLYYFGPGDTLVPDPVFVPLQGTNAALNTDLATRLVTALLSNPTGWLGGATSTAFPLRQRPSVSVRFSGSTAIVNLRGALRVNQFQLRLMADQLVWTLTTPSYRATPVAHAVQLRVNGTTLSVNRQQTLQVQTLGKTPPVVQASTVYLVNGDGGISAYSLGHKTAAKQVVSPAQIGHADISAVAASWTQDELALTAHSSRGCTIYYGHEDSPQPLTPVQLSGRGATCSAVSWDSLGNIWVAAGQHLWVLNAATKVSVPIEAPLLPGESVATTTYQIEALRVAPDGVRVAMLVKTPDGRTQLIAAAIQDEGNVFQLGAATISVGSSVADPTAVSWYDPDHLVVLGRKSQLYLVPLTGGSAQTIGLVPQGTDALTAAGTVMAIGSAGDVMMAGPPGTWHAVTKGRQPVFPG